VVSNKQRRRQLARAKWERQSGRRRVDAKRRRRVGVVVSVIVALVVAAGLIWLVLYILDQEKQDQTPVVPTDSFSTELLTPSSNDGETSGQPTTPPQATSTSPRRSTKPAQATSNSTESSR